MDQGPQKHAFFFFFFFLEPAGKSAGDSHSKGQRGRGQRITRLTELRSFGPGESFTKETGATLDYPLLSPEDVITTSQME
ncbi:hypothetical protein EYF80_058794 [Liparis tanakae]|uniref:Uncharacterized protein n=1 Tax=Liparis tanakae TaxID=230148 RepID=A0A4Z2ERQ7_9TELE|nr:hypothetical protein EYF80_058794 [Liparis tanakae]